MTVFLLRETIEFPPADLAESDGLLAIGGDLSVERLILAYRSGIFPWYNHEPILWWSPSLRPIIFPRLFSMSRSLYQTLKKEIYRVSFDRDFYSVIKGCAAAPRKDSSGTWITTEMMEAYSVLHNLGFAHSVEIWFNDKIIGGLYGVAIGNAFFGESMFTLMKDASKVALACLVKFLIEQDFYFIDCQITNPHLLKMGAVELPRSVFLKILDEALKRSLILGKWSGFECSTKEVASFLKKKLIPRRLKNEDNTF